MNHKKGQVTVFIIIGILLVAAAGAYFYLKASEAEAGIKPVEVTGIASAVNLFVNDCVRDTSEEAVLWIGMQGGYYKVPEPIFPFGVFDVPVFYDEGEPQHVPTAQEFGDQLGIYVSDNLDFCLNNFESFLSQGYSFETGEITPKVLVGEKKVLFNVNYPITVRLQDASQSIDTFGAEVDVQIPKMIKTANQYLDAQADVPDAFRMKQIMDASFDNDVVTETIEFRDGFVMLNIIDPDTQIRDLNYSYIFAIKYNWEDIIPS